MDAEKMSSNDAASATQGSLLEPLASDLEPFLVYSRIDIFANLRLLIDSRVLATVYFNQATNFVVTRLLAVNPEFEELIFDLAPDKRTNEKLQASNGLTVVAFLDHIKVQFTVNAAEITYFEGEPAFRVRTPRSILRLQRRTAFRAQTKLAQSPYIQLGSTSESENETELPRFRITDISATGFAFVAPKAKQSFTKGLRLADCLLELELTKVFEVDIELCHVSVFKDGFGREMCRVGCQYCSLNVK